MDYIPGEWVVELKAFKLYINSFRDQPISHENVINEIANFLTAQIQPRSMRVIGDFVRRGGVKTVITVFRGEPANFERYQANIL